MGLTFPIMKATQYSFNRRTRQQHFERHEHRAFLLDFLCKYLNSENYILHFFLFDLIIYQTCYNNKYKTVTQFINRIANSYLKKIRTSVRHIS